MKPSYVGLLLHLHSHLGNQLWFHWLLPARGVQNDDRWKFNPLVIIAAYWNYMHQFMCTRVFTGTRQRQRWPKHATRCTNAEYVGALKTCTWSTSESKYAIIFNVAHPQPQPVKPKPDSTSSLYLDPGKRIAISLVFIEKDGKQWNTSDRKVFFNKPQRGQCSVHVKSIPF